MWIVLLPSPVSDYCIKYVGWIGLIYHTEPSDTLNWNLFLTRITYITYPEKQ